MTCRSKYIFSIDPGNIESAFVISEADSLKPVGLRKDENDIVLGRIEDFIEQYLFPYSFTASANAEFVIEMVASYGMPVGREVFDTCVWIGRFYEQISSHGFTPHLIYRKDEKMTICHSMKANDATIRQALVDRFAPGQKNSGKGTKKNPGWFYGFHADIWQAYAVGVTWHDIQNEMGT